MPIGSCHKRASTSCSAISGVVFSLGMDGRSLTSGLYVAITPARTANSGNRVPQGKSNFGLLLSAMLGSDLCFFDGLVVSRAAKRAKRAFMKPTFDLREREKIAPGWQQRLH